MLLLLLANQLLLNLLGDRLDQLLLVDSTTLLLDQLLDHFLLLLGEKHCKLVQGLLLRIQLLRMHDLRLGYEMSHQLLWVIILLLNLLLLLKCLLHEATRELRHLLFLLLELNFLSLVVSHVSFLFHQFLKWLRLIDLLKHELSNLQLHEHWLLLAASLDLKSLLFLQVNNWDNLTISIKDKRSHFIIFAVTKH